MDAYTYCTHTNYFVRVQTILYTHTTFSTQIKYDVCIHKLDAYIQHIFNGYTPFVHMQHGCVRVLVQDTFLHVKKGFVRINYTIWYTCKIFCTRKKMV